MADHPALFQALMVRALIDGLKTQTRREKHLQRLRRFGRIRKFGRSTTPGYDWHFRDQDGRWHDLRHQEMLTYLPWHVGDHLWVREAWKAYSTFNDLPPRDIPVSRIFYLADDAYSPSGSPGRPSIFMPRWASRLTLIVTGVRIERLQDINRGDAMEEGCPFPNMADGPNPRDWYATLWGNINGADAWAANPWVVAYTFTVERRNIGEVAHAAA